MDNSAPTDGRWDRRGAGEETVKKCKEHSKGRELRVNSFGHDKDLRFTHPLRSSYFRKVE